MLLIFGFELHSETEPCRGKMFRKLRISFAILPNWLLMLAVLCEDQASESTGALFTHIGRTASHTSFGHLVFDLELEEVKDQFNHLNDMLGTLTEADLETTDAHMVTYGLGRLRKKLELLWEVAHRSNAPTEFEVSAANEFRDALLEDWHESSFPVPAATHPDQENLLPPLFTTARPGLPSPRPNGFPEPAVPVPGAPRSREERDIGGIISGVAGLAAFGHTLFSSYQLSRIYEASQGLAHNLTIVAHRVDEHSLRISELQNHTEAVIESVRTLANKQGETTNTLKAVVKEHLKHKMLAFFNQAKADLTDYLHGIAALMDHRLSPTLINPYSLDHAYQTMLRKARELDLRPLTEDAGIVFQSLTTTMSREGRLYAVVHVPLYTGSLMNMYRFLPAPFLIADGIAVTVSSSHDFIAITDDGTMGKEYTALDFQYCKQINAIFHCPRHNLLQKNLEELCLFAIFAQDVDAIRRACGADVHTKKPFDHAVQINDTTFRIMVAGKTRLTTQCLDGRSYMDTIEGVKVFTLTKECPKATTEKFLFVRNPQIVEAHSVIQLPILDRPSTWLGEAASLLSNLEVVEVLDRLHNRTFSPVSLDSLREALENRSWDIFEDHYYWWSRIVTGLTSLFIIFHISKISFTIFCRPVIRTMYLWCCNVTHNHGWVPGAPPFNADNNNGSDPSTHYSFPTPPENVVVDQPSQSEPADPANRSSLVRYSGNTPRAPPNGEDSPPPEYHTSTPNSTLPVADQSGLHASPARSLPAQPDDSQFLTPPHMSMSERIIRRLAGLPVSPPTPYPGAPLTRSPIFRPPPKKK